MFENPSRNEFNPILHAHDGMGGVRGFLGLDTLYIWDGYLATHHEVHNALGIGGFHLEIARGEIVVPWNNAHNNPDADPNDPITGFTDFEALRSWIKNHPQMRPFIRDFEVFRA